MNPFCYVAVNVVETLLRVVPIPYRTGMIPIGRPDRNSPVFLTCNYHLTVTRVRRALRGIDGYLLVANSHGHNVWCGATGGHFTDHDVISVIKTSGIAELVDHSRVILPQLAAGGIQAKAIKNKTGWTVIWGPVYAKDIRAFIANNTKKTEEMRQVRFPLAQRLEMAFMWAFPFSLIASAITMGIWPAVFLPLNGFLWALPFFIFICFPLYCRWLNPKKKGVGFSKYTVIFDFGRTPLILWGLCVFCLLGLSLMAQSFTWAFILRWGLLFFIVILIISLDLMGSTPLYKSGLHEDRFLQVLVDKEKCKGVGLCEQVCPKNCYDVDTTQHIATLPGAEACVQCGACIIQCPFDALSFIGPGGQLLDPATVRRFKLNLLGRRLKATGKGTSRPI